MGGFTYKTYERSPVWRNDETLSLTDVEISVGSAKVNMSAGLSALKLGRRVVDTVECCKIYKKPHVPCPKIVMNNDTMDCCNLLGKDTARCNEILHSDSLVRREWFLKALKFGRTSISIYPAYSHAMVVLGNAFYELNYIDSAVIWFKRCLEVNPQFGDCKRNLEVASDKARDLGMYKIADIGYSTLLKFDKNNPALYAKAGELAGRYLGDIPRAYTLIKEGLKIDTGNADLMTKMGVVYGLLGKYDSALIFFHRIMERFPDDANNYINLAATYHRLGREDLARAFYQKACSLNPSLCANHPKN